MIANTCQLHHPSDHDDRLAFDRESKLQLNKNDEPRYLGLTTFDTPGKLFTYPRGDKKLSNTEVEEAIEEISHSRDNSDYGPDLIRIAGDLH